MPTNELVLFESQDKSISLNVPLKNDSVWLNRNQMAELFDRDVKTIGKHVNNAIREELAGLPVVAKFATTAADGKTYMVDYYDLDVIISVGYRVKSQRGVEFRKWANSVLRQYIMEGYAVNHNRIMELGKVIRIMKRTQKSLDAQQVLAVIERYSTALDLLDDYDHQTMRRPKGSEATYVLTYEECRGVIDSCGSEMNQHYSATKRTIPLRAALGTSISPLRDRRHIRPWRKRRRICCIL